MDWYERSVAIRHAWYELYDACERFLLPDADDETFEKAMNDIGLGVQRLKDLGVHQPTRET